jgi:mRNA interferase HigB
MLVLRRDIAVDYLAGRSGVVGAPAAQKSFNAWHAITQAAVWAQPADVKASHPKASILKAGRAVFNIKANDYRLVCQINYAAGTVEIRFFGTHEDYDDINADTI